MDVGKGGQEVGRRRARRFGEMMDDGMCIRIAVLHLHGRARDDHLPRVGARLDLAVDLEVAAALLS